MANPTGKGGFRKGHDPNRHELTTTERRRGYDRLMVMIHFGLLPSNVAAHIRRKIRCTGKKTGKHRGAEAAEMKRAYEEAGMPF